MGLPVFGVVSPHPPIFVPAVGGERALVTKASLEALERAARALEHFAPETLVLMSPHAPGFSDAFCVDDSPRFAGSLSQFGDPSVREQDGDPELGQRIAEQIARAGFPVALRSEDGRLRAGWLDHASLVPLHFLDPGAHRSLVVLSLSGLGYAAHRAVGNAVRDAARAIGRRVAFIASGDLSHRLTPDAPAGFSPRARELDAMITGLVEQGRFQDLMRIDPDLIEAGGECGLRSIIALGGYCCEDPAPARVLAYEGPWGVGYLTALVGRAALDADDAMRAWSATTPPSGEKGGMPGADDAEIVRLARSVIEQYVREGRPPESIPPLTDPRYPSRAGVFVSLHRGNELRGCIGTIHPTKGTLAEEVAANAIEAATNDPRFPPLSADELEDLEIKVDVLHEPEACSFDDLDPERYGVIVTSGWRRGLLLPDLPGVEDAETQVLIALKKAGIRAGEPCSLERFRVDRYT